MGWKPITTETSEVCPICGMLVSKNATCSCTQVSDFCTWTNSQNETLERDLVNRDYFTNSCLNHLFCVGSTDLATSLEFILGAVVDICTGSEWLQLWDRHASSCGWTCEKCNGRNRPTSVRCGICATISVTFGYDEDSS